MSAYSLKDNISTLRYGRSRNRLIVLVGVVVLLSCSSAPEILAPQQWIEEVSHGFDWNQAAWLPREQAEPGFYPNVVNLLESPTPALTLYREDVTHQAVVDFFVQLTGSEETAMTIMYHANQQDLPLLTVFSLSWVESNWRRTALNRNSDSVDRGLFQLNSKTFRDLSVDDFFHVDTNVYHGMQYLRYCFNLVEEETTALSIYNAGPGRVLRGETPASTIVYVGRIQEYKAGLEERFRSYIRERFVRQEESAEGA